MITDRLSTALAERYRIERQLGQGGMATVYLALDLKHDRKVALKVLKPELSAVLGGERFITEIRTTASLQHPHILPLFDSGSADGLLYYVMPYVEGETLRAKLDRETQLSVGESVRIAREVADALDYAHRRGVVHRDIKPENILLHDGRPVVAVSDAPRDTTRDHLVVVGGGGLPMFYKQSPHFLLVNGRVNPRPLRMTVGVPQRIRIVSIHADFVLNFRFGTEDSVVTWTPLARDGADLPPALRTAQRSRVRMGPGETADFTYTPARAGPLRLEVWIGDGQRVMLPMEVTGPAAKPAR